MESDLLSNYQIRFAEFRTLQPEAFARGLVKCPDRKFVKDIVSRCTEGVRIGYTGPRESRVCVNWTSVSKFEGSVTASIQKDVSLGRKLGPFLYPPLKDYIASPLGAFQSSKVRVMQDLSYPRGTGINQFISREDYAVQYLSMDEVVSAVKQSGRHTLMAKARICVCDS